MTVSFNFFKGSIDQLNIEIFLPWLQAGKYLKYLTYPLVYCQAKRGSSFLGTTPFQHALDENSSLLLCLHMACSTSCGAGGLVGLLRFLMAAFAIFMIGILCRNGFPLGLGLMAIFTQFPGGLTFLPGMVAFHTVDLQCFGMFLMSECHFPIGRIIFDHIFCQTATHHQDGKT